MAKREIRKIACVGEVMIELVAGADGSARLGVAGDTYNTAVYLARELSDSDVEVSYVTALGTDPYSDRILNAIGNHGLNAELIERRPELSPGLYAIDTDNQGERSFTYWRGQSAARTLFGEPCDVQLSDLNHFDLVYFSGITLAVLPPEIRKKIYAWAKEFSEAGGYVAYDSNYRPRLWESVEVAREANQRMWSIADIAMPSVDDEMALFDDASEAAVLTRLNASGANNGVLKRGAEGPLDLTGREPDYSLTSVSNVVDSTAAGDSFNAGYLAAVAKGKTSDDAMFAGHNLAARVVMFKGAIIPV